MLKKLLKYDFLRIGKYVLYFAAGTAFFTLLSVGVSRFAEKNAAAQILYRLFSLPAIWGCFGIVLFTFARVVVGFRRSTYNDPAHLWQTLPVKRGKLYDAKVLSGVLFMLLSGAIALLCAAAIVFSAPLGVEAKENLRQFFSAAPILIPFIFFVLLAWLITPVSAAFFGITLGHRSESGKILLSVILSVVMNNVIMFASIILMGILMFFLTTGQGFVKSLTDAEGLLAHMDTYPMILMVFGTATIAANAIVLLIGRGAYVKGINVE